MMAAPTVAELSALAGKAVTPEQGAAVLSVVTAMASAYTRGAGFANGVPNADIAAAITTASVRLLSNAGQLDVTDTYGPQSRSIRGAFTGWSTSELACLNRYRVTAR